MKTLTGLLSLAIISGGLLAGAPAQADTVYHRVYKQSVAPDDPFSILDIYQNNALRPEEYRKGGFGPSFASLDHDDNGFLSRSEFYGTTKRATVAYAPRTATELSLITPAAGGTTTRVVYPAYRTIDIVYQDDPCDTMAHRNDGACR